MNNTTRTIRSEEITIDMRILTIMEDGRKNGEIYLAAIAPNMELTVITLDEAPGILPCFDEDDACVNMAQFEPALILKWIFKTAISVWMISNTFGIIMAVFDVTQQVVANSSGIISGNTSVNDIGLSMLESSMMSMDVGPLFGLFLQSFLIGITMRILSIVIFVIVYGRMIEIYMMVSLAPVPMATWGNHEQSHVGQNYLKSLFALGFQGFLILICVAIYAVLIQNIAISGDAIGSIWSIVGYTVLLCFSLFKTSSVAKTLLGAH